MRGEEEVAAIACGAHVIASSEDCYVLGTGGLQGERRREAKRARRKDRGGRTSL